MRVGRDIYTVRYFPTSHTAPVVYQGETEREREGFLWAAAAERFNNNNAEDSPTTVVPTAINANPHPQR